MSETPRSLALIVAMNAEGAIGKKGGLPWRFSEDLKHFRRLTVGHSVLMGRKTWDSIGQPLKRRRNIVLTRQEDWSAEGCEAFTEWDKALDAAYENDDCPFVIGGAALYELALPQVTTLYLTRVGVEVEDADTFFPALDFEQWQLLDEDFSDENPLCFQTWIRRR
jgi:dihydrofolate reductase